MSSESNLSESSRGSNSFNFNVTPRNPRSFTSKNRGRRQNEERFRSIDEKIEQQNTLIYSVLLIVALTTVGILIELFSYRLQTEQFVGEYTKNTIIGQNADKEEDQEKLKQDLNLVKRINYKSITIFE